MKNRKIASILVAGAILAASAMSVGATSVPNPAGGNTDVYVGVTKTTPTNISVTVPTALAIAVVDDGATIETMMGSYWVDAAGAVTSTGDAANGIMAQRVSFVNESKTQNAKITKAKVVNSFGSKWTLRATPAAAYDMSMSLNSVSVGNIAPDNNASIALDFAVPANQTAHMPAAVAAGGTAGDYAAAEQSAKSFVIEWTVEAD